MSTEAMKLALEALEKCEHALAEELSAWGIEPPLHHVQESHDLCGPAIKALEEALAEQAQGEPVAWRYALVVEGQEVNVKYSEVNWNPKLQPFGRYDIDHGGEVTKQPVYTTPQKRKPLRDEMLKQMKESCDSDNMEMRGSFIDGWTSAEAAHGIKE